RYLSVDAMDSNMVWTEMQKALKALYVSMMPHNVSCLYFGTYTIWYWLFL
ncbi:hypothetical protein H5410_046188, partial [Solanum commersonii]